MGSKAEDTSNVLTLPDSEELRWATDELNLAEFPLGFLSDRAPPGVRTRILEDKKWDAATKKHFKRRLIVTASDAFGLPTQGDNEILMALFRIAELYNQFQDPRVQFRLHQVIRLLGWDNHGRSYQRVRLGMDRLATVGIKSERAWWDREAQEHKTRTFSILDSWEDFERKSRRSGTLLEGSSVFVWGDMIFRSLKSRYTKAIDMEVFRSLRSAIAKQIFRLVDKRFRCYGPRWEFDLREFAIEKLGLSGSYKYESEIQKKLAPALQELEALGIVASEARYLTLCRGRHRIVFSAGPRYVGVSAVKQNRVEPSNSSTDPTETEFERLLVALTRRQVSRARAVTLLKKKAAQSPEWIALVDWLVDDHDRRVREGKVAANGAAGWLANAIEMAETKPSIKLDNSKVAKAHSKARHEQVHALVQAEFDRTKADDDVVRSYLEGLSSSNRAAIIEKAWEAASPEEIRFRRSATPSGHAMEMHILHRFILQIVREALTAPGSDVGSRGDSSSTT